MQLEKPVSRASNSFNLRGSLIVRAGAGAGKTTRLIERIALGSKEFLENEGRWPKLVVTTFTRKATQELKERLLKYALAKGNSDFIRFVQSPSQLLVTTIHGLLVRFLREKAQVLGLSPRFQILGEFESEHLWHRCFRKLLANSNAQDSLRIILDSVELPQLEAILIQAAKLNQTSGPLSPIPFQKQWEDLQKAHQEAQSLRRTLLAELSGLPKLSPSWKEFSQRLQDFDSLILEPEFRWPARSAQIPDEIGNCKDRLKEIVQMLRSPSSQVGWMQAQEKLSTHILNLARELQLLREASLLELDALSQSELEIWSLRLLTDFPVVTEDFCQRWDSWMIDEYQDTSPIQDRILDLLRAQKSLFLVGDPQQSLYLFRGARREVFEQKIQSSRDVKHTSNPEALTTASPQAEFLESFENYRTHPELALIVNQLIQNQGPFEALQARKNSPDTRDYRAQWIHRESSQKADRQSLLEWEVEQALRVAMSLRNEEAQSGTRGGARIGILARQNSEVRKLKARAIEKGIPVIATSLAHLSAHPIVEEALRYLQFCIYPHDNINLACILRGAWWGDFAEELMGWNRVNLWQSLKARQLESLLAPPKLEPLEELLRKSQTQGVVETWREFIWNSPLPHRAQSADPSGQILGNLLKLLHQAWAKSREGLTPLLAWLDQSLRNSSDRPDADLAEAKAASSAGIEVMTIHASKGLEFDHVILLGCGQAYRPRPPQLLMKDPQSTDIAVAIKWEESGATSSVRLWPQRTEEWRQWQEDQERAEYARLFYVAVTRAESSLTLISSQIQKRSWAENFPPQFEHLSPLARRLADFPESSSSNPSLSLQERVYASGEFHLANRDQQNPSPISLKASGLGHSIRSSETQTRSLREIAASLKGQKRHRWLESRQNRIEHVQDLADPELVEVLAHGESEFPLQFRMGSKIGEPAQGSLIKAQIDLWCLWEGTLWIVDFKSGSHAFKASSWRQLSIYWEGLTRLYPEWSNLPWCLAIVQTETMQIQKRLNQLLHTQIVFADGAASGNPGPAGWGTIYCSSDDQVEELSGFSPLATNNQMELTAVIEGLKMCRPGERVSVYSDSTYVLFGITQWIHGWRRRGWTTQEGEKVSNQALWEALDQEVQRLGRDQILWNYVRGHSGVPGNERCDELAQAQSRRNGMVPRLSLFQGALQNYSIDLFQLPADTSLPARNTDTKPKAAVKQWYLSELQGQVIRHATWAECERRVKGQSRARFKKIKSSEEERQVLQSWNLSEDHPVQEGSTS